MRDDEPYWKRQIVVALKPEMIFEKMSDIVARLTL